MITELRLTEDELTGWGALIGRLAEPPLVIALRGDLGAGKSTLARAIARGAGVTGSIPSPTFNLLFRYPTSTGRLTHIDLYRLESGDEVWELGWADLPDDDEIVLIEWPERAEAILPEPRWEVSFEDLDDPESRLVRVDQVGEPREIPLPDRDLLNTDD